MKFLKDFIFWSLFLLSAYLLICVIHFSWYIANPEGVWSFFVFEDILRISLILIIVFILYLYGIYYFFNIIFQFIKGKLKFNNFIKKISFTTLIILIFSITTFFGPVVSYLLSSKIAEKYSQIEITEDLIEKGEFNEALKHAKKAYLNQFRYEPNPMFFLTKLWLKSKFNKKNELFLKYESTINYAYCLSLIDGNYYNSKQKFFEALKILQNNIFTKKEVNSRAYFAYICLSNIYFEEKKIIFSEEYFTKALNLQIEFNEKDFEFLENSYLIMLDRSSKQNDFERQKKICYDLIELYKENDMSFESISHLKILLVILKNELYLENYTKVSELLHTIEPIAKKYKETYLNSKFKIIKANYFLELARQNRNDDSFETQSNIWKKLFSFNNKKYNNNELSILQAESSLIDIIDFSLKPKDKFLSEVEIQAYFTYYNILLIKGEEIKANQTLKNLLKIVNHTSSSKIVERIKFIVALNESSQSSIKMKIFEKMMKKKFNDFYNQFTLLNDLDREKLLFQFEKENNILNEYFLYHKNSNYIDFILNNSLNLKELALISQVQINQLFKNQENPKFILYKKLSNEFFKLQNSKSINDNIKIEKVRSNLFALHHELKINNILKKGLKLDITWKEIQSKLNAEDLAIEIIRVPNKNDFKIIYYALLFNSNSAQPKLVKLFYESDLEALLNCPGNIKDRINCVLKTNQKKLYELIFEPIAKDINSKNNIYISKTGLLHKLPLGSLVLDENWNLKCVSSLRQIISKDIKFDLEGIELFGGADFSGLKSLQRNFSFQIPLDIEEKIRQKKISNLPHTKIEVEGIYHIYQSFGKKVSIYTDSLANEYNFRKLSGKKNDVIHIATHGFSENNSYIINSSFILGSNSKNELLRSGIILSPHSSINGLNSENDGLITSLDISNLDFTNYNLVVFSSCESGLGNLFGNQGVYGIIRGLKLAGAKSMILSLWQVPDEQTSKLMIYFYKYYLKNHHPNNALKMAKKELSKEYPNPYYWAGFEYFE